MYMYPPYWIMNYMYTCKQTSQVNLEHICSFVCVHKCMYAHTHKFRSIRIMCLKPVHLDTSSGGKTSSITDWYLLMLMIHSDDDDAHDLLHILSLILLHVIHLLSIRTLPTYHWSESDTVGELEPVDKKSIHPPLKCPLSIMKSQSCSPLVEHHPDYMMTYLQQELVLF